MGGTFGAQSGAWSTNEGEFGVGSYAREYGYDKVGNRTTMILQDEDGNFSRDIEWTLEYNDLNQLTKRFVGTSWSVGTHRIEYDYDDNGNLIGSVEETYSGVWSVSEEWQYDWNPRDQMTRAMKWAGSSAGANNVGSVEYQYCLACDGALSKRFVYAGGSGATRGALQSGQRYEYDGLNLLRVDEIYGSTLSEAGPWRTLEISTHQPGQLAALLHKRVYVHTNNDATPDQTKDFTYSYDPVGNVYSVFDGSGNEAYYFTQDAFGNELPITTLGGSDWNTARADRIVEHQTGKWIDAFTGLYYFWARWYDSGVGRWISDEHESSQRFRFCRNSPLILADFDGNAAVQLCTRPFDDAAGGSPINALPSLLHGHCYLKLIDDDGRERNCGIDPETGLPYPDHDPAGYEEWQPSAGCTPLSSVTYECIREALNRLKGYSPNGQKPPGWGNPFSGLRNNCCDAVYRVINECRDGGGRKGVSLHPSEAARSRSTSKATPFG